MEETFTGNGKVEKKEEASSKNGPYVKFQIEGKTYSDFEYERGNQVRVGDVINFAYTQKTSTKDGKTITFRNIVGYGDLESSEQPHVEEIHIPSEIRKANEEMSGKQQQTVIARASISKDDFWARKEERDIENGNRISRHGAINTAIQIIGLEMQHCAGFSDDKKPTAETILLDAKDLADSILEYVNQRKQ